MAQKALLCALNWRYMNKLILKLGQNIVIGLMGIVMTLEIQVNATESANPEVLKDVSDIERKSKKQLHNYESEVRGYGVSRASKDVKKFKGEAKKIAKEAKVKIDEYKKEVSTIKVKSLKSMNEYVQQNKEEFGMNQDSCTGGEADTQDINSERRLVFLSLSMNERNIEQIIKQSKIYGFTPVIRGFKNGSYIETAQYLASVIEKTGYGVVVDPESFKEFDVKVVPTFVVAEAACTGEGESCKSSKYNKISGNVSLEHVLRTFAKRGDVLGDEAK